MAVNKMSLRAKPEDKVCVYVHKAKLIQKLWQDVYLL